MAKIHLSELGLQLTITERRINETQLQWRFSTDAAEKVKIKAELARLKDRKRVLEDRIIAFEPEADERRLQASVERKPDCSVTSKVSTDPGGRGGTAVT